MTQSSTRTVRSGGGTATSRARQVRPAVRRPVKARLALIAPSGGGKTWTALSVLSDLCPGGRIAVIDTEANEPEGTAAELYADQFTFEVIPWDPPYDPRDLAATIVDLGVQGYDGIVVDSATHFWRGEGGTLDIADGRFGGWKVATPAQNDLVDAILRSPAHVIVCTRAKEQYLVTENNGKQEVTKIGLGAIQRDDLEYEFQVVATLTMDHRLDIGKTRASVLAGRSYPPNHEHHFAAVYGGWLARGVQLLRMAEVEAVRKAVRGVDDYAEKAKPRIDAFKTTFGTTDGLERDQLPDVWAWIAMQRGIEAHAFTPGEPPERVGAGPDGPGESDEVYAARLVEAESTCTVCQSPILAAWHAVEAATSQSPSEAPEPQAPAQDAPPPVEAVTEPQRPLSVEDDVEVGTCGEPVPGSSTRLGDPWASCGLRAGHDGPHVGPPIVETTATEPTLPEACWAEGCVLAAEHEGDHVLPPRANRRVRQ